MATCRHAADEALATDGSSARVTSFNWREVSRVYRVVMLMADGSGIADAPRRCEVVRDAVRRASDGKREAEISMLILEGEATRPR